jgi:hypothetical protein
LTSPGKPSQCAELEQKRNIGTGDMVRTIAGALAAFLLAGTVAGPLLARPLVPAERRYFPYSGALPS